MGSKEYIEVTIVFMETNPVNPPVVESYFPPLKAWALRRYELVYDGQGVGNYSAWDIIALLDAKQIDLNAEVRIKYNEHSMIPKEKAKILRNSEIYKYADFLRSFAGTSMQVMLFDSLEKLRVRFLWWSIGVGIMMAVFFLFGIRVYNAQ